jgi:hypothetical protein
MNTNIILDGFNAMLKQLILTAVADAVKPLKERIAVLEAGEWTKTQHIVAKEIQPLQDRVIALEINQSMGKAVFTLPDVDFNEAVRNVLDGYNFINRNDVVDLVDKVVQNAIEAYDFSEVDMCGAMESAIENYDFSNIVEENMPDMVDEDRVQEMIDETIDNCTIRRG